jgi:hypothetical protein
MQLLFATFILLLSTTALGHIIGSDDRKVGDGTFPEIFPITFIHTGAAVCSGTLIAKNLVLTNLHCVWSIHLPQVYIKFHQLDSYYHLNAKRVFISNRVQAGRPYDKIDDWAILQLDDNVGEEVGFCKIASVIPEPGSKINMAGYHGDLDMAVGIENGCNLLRRTDILSRDSAYKIAKLDTTCDSTPGSSGASVYTGEFKSCEVVGLNIAHVDVSPSGIKNPVGTVLKLPADETHYLSVAISVKHLIPIAEMIASGQTSGAGYKTLHPETP